MTAAPADMFISDVHLDEGTVRRARTLLAFFERHASRAARLFILGDLFNVWIGRKQMVAPYVREITGALRRLVSTGVEVHFVAGNRDFYGLDLLGQAAGLVVHKTGFAVDSLGVRTWVCHGHCLYRHDRRTHRAQAVTHSRPVEWLFQNALPAKLAMYLARGYNAHSQRVVRHKSRRMLSISDEALAELLAEGYEAIVCGHTHRLARLVCRAGGREGHLYNLGAWDDFPHFLRHGPDGWHFHRLADD